MGKWGFYPGLCPCPGLRAARPALHELWVFFNWALQQRRCASCGHLLYNAVLARRAVPVPRATAAAAVAAEAAATAAADADAEAAAEVDADAAADAVTTAAAEAATAAATDMWIDWSKDKELPAMSDHVARSL